MLPSMADQKYSKSEQYKGWLYKWTNYLKGYQKRWFVLQNGLLSYYRNQEEVAHTCRGTINLANANIQTCDSGSCSFTISNGGTQTFHLKATSVIDRQSWVTALELAKEKAMQIMESDDEEEANNLSPLDKDEVLNLVQTLSTKLEDLNTCNDLITKHGPSLQRALGELEQLDNAEDSSAKFKTVIERATLFRITSNAMINACAEYLEFAQTQGKRWQKLIQSEHEQKLRLEEMVEQLARQHSSFEKKAKKSFANLNHASKQPDLPPVVAEVADDSDEEEEFFDTVDMEEIVRKPTHARSASGISYGSSDTDLESTPEPLIQSAGRASSANSLGVMPCVATARKRRSAIPERPNISINLWGIMKNCIGKDLTKIPVPVNFSEPLSFLQRITEDFDYSDCLDRASKCSDPCEQIAYVAAFTISAYSNLGVRTGKPFNPLLGETYECDRRDDRGWRAVAEQVIHHPPTCAVHTEGKDWVSWQDFSMSSKFRGKYVQIIPLGIAHLVFKGSDNHYTWRKVTTTAHNIVVGKLWVDNHGEMDIINHKTGDKCHLQFHAYSYFSREKPRRVTGVVTDAQNRARYVIQGTWDDRIETAKVMQTSESSQGRTVYETGTPKVVWQRRYPPPELEKCYHFTELAVELNEPEEFVAPTDSRLRPDQRLMEQARWDDANLVKIKLEEKQRAVRRKREAEAHEAEQSGRPYEGYKPRWFKKQSDPQTGNEIHMFTNEYWACKDKQDWGRCPDIYLDRSTT